MHQPPKTYRSLIVCIAIFAGLLSLWVRWDNATLLGPEIDRSSLHYWAQSTVAAPSWGFREAIKGPANLARHPETKLYQLLGPAYNLPVRLVNLAPVLLIGLWSSVFGFGTTSALLLGWLQTLAIAASLAIISWKLTRQAESWIRDLVSALVFLSVLSNPLLLVQSTWVSWHSTALAFMIAAGLAAYSTSSPSHQSSRWSRRRRLVVGILLVLALYSSYLLPLLFVGSWATSACLPFLGREKRPRLLNEVAFWAVVLLAFLPAVLWILARPSSTVSWLDHWTSFQPTHSLHMVGKLALSSSGLVVIGLVALLHGISQRRTADKTINDPTSSQISAVWIPYLAVSSALLIGLLNDPQLDRLLLYLVPWNMVILVRYTTRPQRSAFRNTATRRHNGWLALAAALVIGFLALSAWPRTMLRIVSKSTLDQQEYATLGRRVALALKDQHHDRSLDIDGPQLAFRNRDLASLIMVRIPTTGSVVTNLERLLDAHKQDNVQDFWATHAPPGGVHWPLTLVGDPQADTLIPRLRQWYTVLVMPLDGAPGWFLARFEPK